MSGENLHLEKFFSCVDPVTGRTVIRLTSLEHHCHHPYFYYRAFSPDSRFLLYSSNQSGTVCLYCLDLETGESRLLSSLSKVNTFSSTFSADGRYVYFPAGDVLYRLEFSSGLTEEVYRQKPPFNGRGIYPGFSDNFRLVLLAQIHQEDVYHGKQGWDFYEPQCRLKPRCRLLLVNLQTGEEKVVLEERGWLGHPQVRPGDQETLMYCHEGPHYLTDSRIWLIQADGTRKRSIGYGEKSSEERKEIVTHEYFTPDGRYIAYTHFPAVYGQDGTIRMTEVDTGKEIILGQVHNYSHPFHSPDGCFIVGDEVNKSNPASACIWLFDIARRQESSLCLHGSSFAPRG
ncbi:MAG: oligogalacturonate lyase family protein, partial [Candidatus Omnitrophica bacterium]|nr:oligogalacturonate lyase family protein [Candidatus Omnitrophota bacterium]